jgi:hypothetical protein
MLVKRTIRVKLKQDPQVEVVVNTTEEQVHAKLRGIAKDIQNQKFARWAPFAGQRQAGRDSTQGWYTEIEGDNMGYDPAAAPDSDPNQSEVMHKLDAIAQQSGFRNLRDLRNSMTERTYAAQMQYMMQLIKTQ